MSPIGVGARWMLAAGILIPLAACSQEQQKASAKTAAEEIWKEYAAGLNSGDIDGWLALWTADGVQMPPDEPPVVGKENIRVRNEAVLEKFSFDIDITNQEVEAAGDWAYSRGTYKARLVPRQGGAPILIDGKYMSILARQRDGSWKIHRDIFNSNVPPQPSQ